MMKMFRVYYELTSKCGSDNIVFLSYVKAVGPESACEICRDMFPWQTEFLSLIAFEWAWSAEQIAKFKNYGDL